MGIVIITGVLVCVMYCLSFISYINENNIIDEIIAE